MSLDSIARSTVRVHAALKAFVSSPVVYVYSCFCLHLDICSVVSRFACRQGAWRDRANKDRRTQQAGCPIRNLMVDVFHCWAAQRYRNSFKPLVAQQRWFFFDTGL